ncbi:MAG: SipW-dependent-type signal peptide-containing protein [Clostridia bacterium]|nr:SipW-dependent-type signal peptide-containing protein [Clostridia bacterium]
MKLSKRALVTTLALMLAMTMSVFGTVAYLTSSAKATNTFTVGDVEITLEETDVDEDGNPKYPVDNDGDGDTDRIITVDPEDGTITVIDPKDPDDPTDDVIIDTIEPTGKDEDGNFTYPDADLDGDGDDDKITVDEDGNIVLDPGTDDEETIEPGKSDGNEYNVVPGEEYLKDPTVTVIKGSEESYVRMRVEITNYAAVKEALGVEDDKILSTLAPDLNTADWTQKSATVKDDVLTVVFWYKEPVDASDAAEDVELPALFETFTVPGTLTKDDLQAIADMKMDIYGDAIQTASFDSAEEAWASFGEQEG